MAIRATKMNRQPPSSPRVPSSPGHDLLTDRELAIRWGLSPKTLANWRCAGLGLRYLKIGSKIRYRLSDVLQFEADRTFANTAVATLASTGRSPGS
jgi:hypothetical protein